MAASAIPIMHVAGVGLLLKMTTGTLPCAYTKNMALACTLPGDTKKTLCRISFLVTSRISLVTFTSLPTVGGTRRKSRILKEREPCQDEDGQEVGRSPVSGSAHRRNWLVFLLYPAEATEGISVGRAGHVQGKPQSEGVEKVSLFHQTSCVDLPTIQAVFLVNTYLNMLKSHLGILFKCSF